MVSNEDRHESLQDDWDIEDHVGPDIRACRFCSSTLRWSGSLALNESDDSGLWIDPANDPYCWGRNTKELLFHEPFVDQCQVTTDKANG
jgi:hypothetical protein